MLLFLFFPRRNHKLCFFDLISLQQNSLHIHQILNILPDFFLCYPIVQNHKDLYHQKHKYPFNSRYIFSAHIRINNLFRLRNLKDFLSLRILQNRVFCLFVSDFTRNLPALPCICICNMQYRKDKE